MSGKAARREKRGRQPLPSRAFSHARGHLRVSGVLLDGPKKKKRETARNLQETFVAGFSLFTEPPSVEGNLTSEPSPRVQVPYHSVWRKTVFWTWLEEMFIPSDMSGGISLLNVYCGAAMVEVCLWSKKSAIRWVFGPQTTFE